MPYIYPSLIALNTRVGKKGEFWKWHTEEFQYQIKTDFSFATRHHKIFIVEHYVFFHHVHKINIYELNNVSL